jgi:O-antigen/teichoic acid export membrane protein
MARPRALLKGTPRVLAANVGARVVALVSLSLATLMIARVGGPAAVGIYALLRVLPGLIGVLASAGLPGAIAYFLAGPSRADRRLPLTICATALAGGVAGTVFWWAVVPLAGGKLFPGLSQTLLLVAGCTVLTQLVVATAKSCSQGSDDLPGANLVIVNEEFMFLPAYGLLWLVGVRGNGGLVAGLLIADIATFVPAWIRLARRGYFRDAIRPSLALARRLCGYGMRAQVGGLMSLLNLRLDFVILSLMTGPAVLGVYAIASKFAELLKIPGLALSYVLYPTYARIGREQAAAKARSLMRKVGPAIAAAALPLWFAAGYLIPAIYGPAFEAAVRPAQIIIVGLVLEGVAGVITAFLYGIGRPGLNSWGMAVGLATTVVLDLALIPRFHAIGAAYASAAAYLASTLALVWFFRQTSRPPAGGGLHRAINDLHTKIDEMRSGIAEFDRRVKDAGYGSTVEARRS